MLKVFVLLLFFIVPYHGVAQSYTEKYNDIYNRYDYFNNDGKLVGYKYYDTLERAWKYKDISVAQNSGYIDPINSKLVNKVLASKQNSYNTNVQRITDAIRNIYEEISKLKCDISLRESIYYRFKKETIGTIDKSNTDYSNNQSSQAVINFLYDSVNTIIKEECENSAAEQEDVGSKQVDPNLNKFLMFSIIEEYSYTESDGWKLVKKETSQTIIEIEGNDLSFNKNNTGRKIRNLDYQGFDKYQNSYIYHSDYGDVCIDKNFESVTFYNGTIADSKTKFIYKKN